MELQMIDVNKIQPDKNQPRQTIDPVRIHEMATSIRTEGVINPIEIDENNIIVTGEMRWRSAKEAGLKQVPCKIVHFEGRERFRRQVVENIHHNTMTTMDTAEALQNLLILMGWKPDSQRRLLSVRGNKGKFIGSVGDEYVTRFSQEIGKTTQYIYDYLNLIKELPEVREWLRKPDAKMSLIREINKLAPKEAREELKRKVVSGDINNYRIATELSKAIKQAPNKKDELLAIDWSKTTQNGVKKIHEIVPIFEPIDDIETMQETERIVKKLTDISIFFKEHHPDDFPIEKVAELKVTFQRVQELGNAFFLRINTIIKGELS
jgi:hypothetical protein